MKLVLFLVLLAFCCALCEAGQLFSSEAPAHTQRRTRYEEERHEIEERLAEEQRAADQATREMEAHERHLIAVLEHAAELQRAETELTRRRRTNASTQQIMKQKTLVRQLKTNPPTATDPEAQFGKFVCIPCGNTWYSANAYQGFRQGCHSCPLKTPTLPVTLRNHEGNQASELNGGPHQSADCERCQRQLPCRGSWIRR